MPIYPQLTLKGKNTILLNPERVILYLTFTDKDDENVITTNMKKS